MIIQLIPAYTPLWQISAGPDGEVVMTPVVCIALAEDEQATQRIVCPMVPADSLWIGESMPNHVTYAASADPAPWVERCKIKRMELVRKAAEPRSKIVVPDKRVVTAKDLVH